MKKFLFSMAMAATIAGILLVSCKKENETVQTNKEQSKVSDAQNDAVVRRIIGFKRQVDFRTANPGVKSGEVMTLEEAMNNVVDLFNVTYAEPMAYYTESERHGFTINVSLTSDGKVLLDDVVSVYEQAVSLSREAYHSSSLPNKDYRRLMVTSAPQRDGSVDLHFDGSYGSKGIVPPPPQNHHAGPFGPGDDWHFMDGMGSCDGTRPGGADKVLQDTIMAEVHSKWPVDLAESRGFFTNFVTEDFDGSDHSGVFYRPSSEGTCIGWQFMNDYLFGEKHNIYQVVPSQLGINLNNNPMQIHRYYVTKVEIAGTGSEDHYLHWTFVEYGRYNYISSIVIPPAEL